MVDYILHCSNTLVPYILCYRLASSLGTMTSIKLPIPIDPDKTYPVVWKSGGASVIRELPGYHLLSSTNSKSYLYRLQEGGQRKVETAAGVTINTLA